MGYRFEHVDLPESAATARAHAEECLDLGGACGSWPRCRDEYESLAAAHQFALNIAGMGLCRELMRRAGMTYQATPRPFPDWPFDGIDDWRNADQSRRDAYKEAERAAAAQSGHPGAGSSVVTGVDSNWLFSLSTAVCRRPSRPSGRYRSAAFVA